MLFRSYGDAQTPQQSTEPTTTDASGTADAVTTSEPPTITITSPSDGSVFAVGEIVVFLAQVEDDLDAPETEHETP